MPLSRAMYNTAQVIQICFLFTPYAVPTMIQVQTPTYFVYILYIQF